MPFNIHHNTLAPRAGLGFRRELIPALHQGVPESIGFFEVAPENWAGMGGRAGRDFRASPSATPLCATACLCPWEAPAPLDEILLRRTPRLHARTRHAPVHRTPVMVR